MIVRPPTMKALLAKYTENFALPNRYFQLPSNFSNPFPASTKCDFIFFLHLLLYAAFLPIRFFFHHLLQSPTKTHNFHLLKISTAEESNTKNTQIPFEINFQGDFGNPFRLFFSFFLALWTSNQFVKRRWGAKQN